MFGPPNDVRYAQETAKPKSALPSAEIANGNHAAVDSAPLEVWRTYMNAVKKNDRVAARQCWCISGNDSGGALDVIAGMWVAYHRLNAALVKLGKDGEEFVRDDCTDEAIDRTLARLKDSQVKIASDTATLTIRWAKNDGYPHPAFWYGEPVLFRKVAAGWRIDALAMCGLSKPEEFFPNGGGAFRDGMAMTDEIASGLESGKLKSAGDVVRAMEKHVGSLEGRISFTKTVIFEEDSPARYLRIKKGNPDIESTSGEQLPQRKDIKYPRKVEGDLRFIFETMHGWDHPRIVVETSNKKGFEVVYNPDDAKALEIVAGQLGMTVGEGDREILALAITVGKDGHHLKPVDKPATPQWDSCVTQDDIWPLHGITLDELARFLEARFRRPVVNKTGLNGYYWLELSGKTVRVWPQREDETKPLDQTGLQLHWERVKTKVLVVKDK